MSRKGENVFRRKDGRWVARFIVGRRDGRAVYGSVTAKTYAEVKLKRESRIADMGDIPVCCDKPPILRDLAMQWVESLRPIRKRSTIVKYVNQLDSIIFPAMGSMKINEIVNNDVIEFSNSLLRKRNDGGHGYSVKTAADIMSRIWSIHKYAVIRGFRLHFTPYCVSMIREPSETRILSIREEKSLYDRIKYELNQKLDLKKMGIIICLFTGLRVGEICALKWNDVNFDEKVIRVNKTMQRLQVFDRKSKVKTNVEISAPKSSAAVRIVPISEFLMKYMELAYEESGFENAAFILSGSAEYSVEPRVMEYNFSVMAKKCGITNVNFHALRHTFATRCIEAGFDPKSLSEILGHASVGITLNRYVHPTIKSKHENMSKLSKLIEERFENN